MSLFPFHSDSKDINLIFGADNRFLPQHFWRCLRHDHQLSLHNWLCLDIFRWELDHGAGPCGALWDLRYADGSLFSMSYPTVYLWEENPHRNGRLVTKGVRALTERTLVSRGSKMLKLSSYNGGGVGTIPSKGVAVYIAKSGGEFCRPLVGLRVPGVDFTSFDPPRSMGQE